MKYRHNDKSEYDNVMKLVRSGAYTGSQIEQRLETLKETYGHTYEYERTINQINNYIMKKVVS